MLNNNYAQQGTSHKLQFLVDIYRKYFESLVPYSVMIGAYKAGAFPFLKNRVKLLLDYYDEQQKKCPLDDELKEVMTYIKRDPFQLLPYDFVREYNNRKVPVYRDSNKSMYYVVENDKKLYFKRGMSKSEIVNRFNALSSEQDIFSPHRYMTNECHMIGAFPENGRGTMGFSVEPNDVVADLGAAEGNFSISVIDKVQKVYMFEYDKEWLYALEQTFKPYSEKAVIIPQMIADQSDANAVSIDDYFKDLPLTFIKADLEGYETKALQGASKTIETAKNMKAAICVYHEYNHANDFEAFFDNNKYAVDFSKGYMHPWTITSNVPPYFTKGVLRAYK